MWTPRSHVIYLSPLAVPSPESPFLPRDLCMVSSCLGHIIPFSPLLSSPGAHLPASPGLHILTLSVSTSHPLNLVPPSNSPEMFALAVPLWAEARWTVQMFVHMQPNPEHRTEKHHSSRWHQVGPKPRGKNRPLPVFMALFLKIISVGLNSPEPPEGFLAHRYELPVPSSTHTRNSSRAGLGGPEHFTS